MHRGAGRTQILFFGLVFAAIVLLFVPDEHSGELRGRALSSMRPVLEFFGSGKPPPQPRQASIEVAAVAGPDGVALPTEQPARPEVDDNPRMKLLLKQLDELEKGTPAGQARITALISLAFHILTRAAREKR